MQKNVSRYDHLPPDDTESFLRRHFKIQVDIACEKGEISEDMKESLLSLKPVELDELDYAYKQLKSAIENKAWYQLIARIEKAEVVIAAEQDMHKKDFYIAKMNELISQMDDLHLNKKERVI